MLYVYKQFECPMNVTGVPIEISVVDANGNYRTIGTTTSDADGFYSIEWTPDIEGKFTLYASFLGSAAYYPSHAVTAFAAAPETQTTTQPTQEPQSTTDLYFLPMSIAIIVAVVVIGALIMLLLLKKKP